jgi:GNAT superfamily N-acetyltransferase
VAAHVERLTSANEADFFRLHGDPDSAGWCWCVAWWTDTWEGFGDRTSAQNRRLRESLLDRDQRDGYLLYNDPAGPTDAADTADTADVVGWCQVGPRDRLTKLVSSYQLEPDPSIWAVTCFFLRPSSRGDGLATALLRSVVEDLDAQGVAVVQGFPRRGELPAEDVWTGTEGSFVAAGFRCVRDDPKRPVFQRG